MLNREEYQPCEGILCMDSMDFPKPCDKVDCKDIDSLPLAMAYVPWQKWKNVYNNDVALNRGTLFPELDLPFLGRGGAMKYDD